MNPTNKKAREAGGILHSLNRQVRHAPQRKPVVAQLKTGVSAQSSKRPVAPPAYRPQATPKAAQPKMASGGVNRKPQVAPPVYRPQPAPRVLQTKISSAQRSPAGQSPRQPVAPPVYRPEAKKIVQPKAISQLRLSPAAPPVYRPEQKRVAQPKMASAAQAHTPPKAPPGYRPQAKQANAQSSLTAQMKATLVSPQVQKLAVSFRPARPVPFSAAPSVAQAKFMGQNIHHKEDVEMMEEMAGRSIAWAIDGLQKTVAYLKDEISEPPDAFNAISKWLGWSEKVSLVQCITYAQQALKVLTIVLNSEWKVYDAADDKAESPSEDLAFGYAYNGTGNFYLLSGFYDQDVLLKLDTMIHEATHAVASTSDHGCKSSGDALGFAKARPDLAPTCAYNLACLAVQIMNARFG
ncbi:MAG TPA: hypothetical protein DC054_05710 [Blastocatellia bacterium]|nr:hypothetical protein [Blastocatellia bacterium]